VEIFYGMLEYYEPTVVGLQEFCKFWMADFHQYRYRDRWGLLEFDNVRREGEKVLSTVLYRKDLCTLVDSGMHYYSVHNNGRCRCYTWALLKIKATGKEFCFVSTHWDGHKSPNTMQQVAEITEFVREMSKRCPVITTGDFNTGEREEAMIQYLRDIDSADAMHESDERLNVQGSWHDWAKDYSSYNSIDHITVTRPSRSLQFETLYYNEQIYASDHAWLLADVLLGK
jgi:endonuclease/exonuclease/phosphatase family metal-dependent hydrolase